MKCYVHEFLCDSKPEHLKDGLQDYEDRLCAMVANIPGGDMPLFVASMLNVMDVLKANVGEGLMQAVEITRQHFPAVSVCIKGPLK